MQEKQKGRGSGRGRDVRQYQRKKKDRDAAVERRGISRSTCRALTGHLHLGLTPAPMAGLPRCLEDVNAARTVTFTGVTSQGKQFHRQYVLPQELPFGKFGPPG